MIKKRIIISSAAIYSLLALYVVFVYQPVPFSQQYTLAELFAHRANFVPFKSILEYIYMLFNDHINIAHAAKFFIGNIAILLPLGMCIAYFQKNRSIYKCLFIGLAVSIIMETMQILFRIGSFDIDCVILRTIGMILGGFATLFIYKLYSKFINKEMN